MKWDRSKGRPEPIRALNRILEKDNGEPLVDLRIACPSIKLPRDTTIPYVRATVAQKLEQAASLLPDGIFIAVTDAWRPFIRQVKIAEWMSACIREAHPGISHASLRRILCRWVAPVDQKAPPGHCTGAAVDIQLMSSEGTFLDVTSPYARLAGGPTYVYGLTPEAEKNRMMMLEAMLEAGFSNCRDEYWHYSYGDAGWAVRLGFEECCYGLIELDESEWLQKQEDWEAAMRGRPNPFLEDQTA